MSWSRPRGRTASRCVESAFVTPAVAVGLAAQIPPDWSPEEIERAVADELAEPKYRLGAPWWSRLIEWLEQAWVRIVEWMTAASDYVGGPVIMAILVGGVVLVVVALATFNLGKRRARRVDERIRREHEAARGLDPVSLEQAAESAQERGDHGEALRLLFRAALIRMDRVGLIDLRPGTTSGTVASSINSPEFDRVAARFDSVVYGGKPAGADDVTMVRQMTRSLLEGARR